MSHTFHSSETAHDRPRFRCGQIWWLKSLHTDTTPRWAWQEVAYQLTLEGRTTTITSSPSRRHPRERIREHRNTRRVRGPCTWAVPSSQIERPGTSYFDNLQDIAGEATATTNTSTAAVIDRCATADCNACACSGSKHGALRWRAKLRLERTIRRIYEHFARTWADTTFASPSLSGVVASKTTASYWRVAFSRHAHWFRHVASPFAERPWGLNKNRRLPAHTKSTKPVFSRKSEHALRQPKTTTPHARNEDIAPGAATEIPTYMGTQSHALSTSDSWSRPPAHPVTRSVPAIKSFLKTMRAIRRPAVSGLQTHIRCERPRGHEQ